MRIVAGTLRGRAIVAPKGQATRPTADRAREAIFNILAHAPYAPPLQGARVLDLFAGSGALGLEALSRGAEFCLFVETDAAARAAINENLEALGQFGSARVLRRDATTPGPRPSADGRPFDFAFLDPPYGKGLGETALAALIAGEWMAAGGLAIFERGADEPPVEIAGFTLEAERRYGAAQILFLRRA